MDEEGVVCVSPRNKRRPRHLKAIFKRLLPERRPNNFKLRNEEKQHNQIIEASSYNNDSDWFPDMNSQWNYFFYFAVTQTLPSWSFNMADEVESFHEGLFLC